MSTFTNWNGPGDIPGDLTIFYQRLSELEKKIIGVHDGCVDEKAFLALKAEVDKIPAALKELEDAIEANTEAIEALGENKIDGILEDIKALQDGIAAAYEEGTLGEVEFIKALKVWVFDALETWVNRLKVYDAIAFKKTDDTDVLNEGTAATCAVSGGWYILAVVDASDTEDAYGHGEGTAYFEGTDSMNLAAVVHFVVHREQPGNNTYHGALNVTYCYSSSGSSSTGNMIKFEIITGTDKNGSKPVHYVCCQPFSKDVTSGTESSLVGSIAYVWTVGRNVRRFDASKDAHPANGTIVCNVISERGTAEDGACHGTLLTGLRTNDFSTYGSVDIEDYLTVGKDLEVAGDTEIKGDLTVLGNISGAAPSLVGTDLNVNSLTTTQKVTAGNGLTVSNGGASVKGATNVDGALTATGAISGASINSAAGVSAGTGDIRTNSGNLVAPAGSVNAPAGTSSLGALNLSGATLNAPNATGTFKALNVNGALAATGVVRGNPLQSNRLQNEAANNMIETADGAISVGNANNPLRLRGTNNRLQFVAGTGSGATKDVAYLDDILAGMEFQRAVTVFRNVAGQPPASFTSVVLDTGQTLTFEEGDTCLSNGTLSSPPAVYTLTSGAWVKTYQYPQPPKAGIDYMEWEWFGLAANSAGIYARSYVIWNPNNETTTEPTWSALDIHMEIDEYRTAEDQDKLDATLGKLASYQPDWLDDTPMITVPAPIPPGIPSQIPNPAYIQNKPFMGLSVLNGGDWSDLATLAYDVIVDGGDYTAVPNPNPVVDQSIKDVVIKISHGLVAALPTPSAATAYTLRYATDTKELYIDTGTENVLLATGA